MDACANKQTQRTILLSLEGLHREVQLSAVGPLLQGPESLLGSPLRVSTGRPTGAALGPRTRESAGAAFPTPAVPSGAAAQPTKTLCKNRLKTDPLRAPSGALPRIKNKLKTTLNNGYLGSRNDEERSEMRYVV